MSELDAVREQLDDLIATAIGVLPPNGGMPADEQGPLTNLAHFYRLRAIARFLGDGDEAGYAADLHRSGQARLFYLRGCAKGAACSPAFYRTSRNRAFFDCLSINDLDTAEALALGCDDRFVERYEYEEDHLVVQYAQTAFLSSRGKRDARASGAVLLRLEKALEEAPHPQLALCGALEQRDAGEFESALEAVMTRAASNYEQAAKDRAIPPVVLATERWIDVQGIATVRLAELLGIKSAREEFPRVPAELVRLARSQPARSAGDSWRRAEG